MIKITNLHKQFGKLKVLKGIDIDVAKGEIIAIIGPSGSGKSTFLRCINRLEEPTEGDIIINGKSIMDKSTDINLMRRELGMVFQHFNLFPHKTVMENITLSYSVPKTFLQRLKVQNMRLSLSVRNPFVLTSWNFGDVEGEDYTMKTYNLSINFTL